MRNVGWVVRLMPAMAAVVALSGVALAAASLAFASPGSPSLVVTAAIPAAVCDASVANGVNWRGPNIPEGGSTPAYRIAPLLDARGALTGRRVSIGTVAATVATLDLPAESFAAGPFGRVVLVGADDGHRSTLRFVDAFSGCVTPVAVESAVIRRATVAPDTGTVYEFRVARATRAELGVWRRAAATAERVLPPLEWDDRYGITFSTELAWRTDGGELAVQSCGASLCRTRVLDVSTGRVRRVETADQGEMIALAGDRVVTYGACRGLPCPIHGFDADTGDEVVLSVAAGAARAVSTPNGVRIVHERGDGRPGVLAVDPRSGAATAISLPANTRLPQQPSRSDEAFAVSPGWVPLVVRDSADDLLPAAFLRLADGMTVEVTGATR